VWMHVLILPREAKKTKHFVSTSPDFACPGILGHSDFELVWRHSE